MGTEDAILKTVDEPVYFAVNYDQFWDVSWFKKLAVFRYWELISEQFKIKDGILSLQHFFYRVCELLTWNIRED